MNTRSKHKRLTLPFLVLLFLFSYTALIRAVITQGKTIESQRSLIHLLFKDNLHLNTLRKNQDGQKLDARSSAQTQAPASQVETAQAPSTQVPLTQVPSNKSGPQVKAKTAGKPGKVAKPLPAKPPSELVDPSDMRRVTFSI